MASWWRVGAFEIEGQTAWGSTSRRIAAELNLLELLRLAAAHGLQQAVVRSGLRFADVIVQQAFRIIADAIGIPLFIAVGDLLGNRDVQFGKRGVAAVLKTLLRASAGAGSGSGSGGIGLGARGFRGGAETGGAHGEGGSGGSAAESADECAAASAWRIWFRKSFVGAREWLERGHEQSPQRQGVGTF